MKKLKNEYEQMLYDDRLKRCEDIPQGWYKIFVKIFIEMPLWLQKLAQNIVSFFVQSNLNFLAIIFGSDKYGPNAHSYTPHYMTHFKTRRYKKLKLLEIGVGGYGNPISGGGGLRMWKRYFPNSKIFGVDIYDKSALEEHRIKIFKGSQVDSVFLDSMVKQTGDFDIIIDDGSHINEHVIETFKILFPKLNYGGIYVIEDMSTSYCPRLGGDNENLNNPNTIMNFFKKLTDSLNYQEYRIDTLDLGEQEALRPTAQIEANKISYYDGKIISMHFYHNLLFVYKGFNNEKSNVEC
ncbi:MAG: hypothetical protein Ta2B_20230 [Termitinemataceae bacterium]|nr:MAG: hypothetical protein Ta2B_20230 [Termitinemataceae bacterium]